MLWFGKFLLRRSPNKPRKRNIGWEVLIDLPDLQMKGRGETLCINYGQSQCPKRPGSDGKNHLEKGEAHFCGHRRTKIILALGTETNPEQGRFPGVGQGQIRAMGSGREVSGGETAQLKESLGRLWIYERRDKVIPRKFTSLVPR